MPEPTSVTEKEPSTDASGISRGLPDMDVGFPFESPAIGPADASILDHLDSFTDDTETTSDSTTSPLKPPRNSPSESRTARGGKVRGKG